MSEVAVKKLPARKDVRAGDTWDLTSLFRSDAAWEEALGVWEDRIPQFAAYAGTLGQSAERLAECLAHDLAFDREGDRLGTYAHLRSSEDQAAADAQRMLGRYQHVATRAGEAASFIRPEIMAIPAVDAARPGWMPPRSPPTASRSSGSCGRGPTCSPTARSGSWPCRAPLPGPRPGPSGS